MNTKRQNRVQHKVKFVDNRNFSWLPVLYQAPRNFICFNRKLKSSRFGFLAAVSDSEKVPAAEILLSDVLENV